MLLIFPYSLLLKVFPIFLTVQKVIRTFILIFIVRLRLYCCIVQFLFIFSVVNNSPVTLGDYVYPAWADGLGWLMFVVSFAMIPLIAVVEAAKICLENRSHLSLVWRHCQTRHYRLDYLQLFYNDYAN